MLPAPASRRCGRHPSSLLRRLSRRRGKGGGPDRTCRSGQPRAARLNKYLYRAPLVRRHVPIRADARLVPAAWFLRGAALCCGLPRPRRLTGLLPGEGERRRWRRSGARGAGSAGGSAGRGPPEELPQRGPSELRDAAMGLVGQGDGRAERARNVRR